MTRGRDGVAIIGEVRRRPLRARSRILRRGGAALALAAALAAVPAVAQARGDADTAALQVALRAHAAFDGTVDGVFGPATAAAVAAFQHSARLPSTGVAGPLTRAALGVTRPLGSRPLLRGCSGSDVAALQFALAWHGFPSGPFDGRFGPRVERALLRFERWAALPPDGVAGQAVLAALRAPQPFARVALSRPLPFAVTSPFGPRGGRFHAGVDIAAPSGTPVSAAAGGRVVYAGWRDGGWGNEVTVASGGGVRVVYAHLSDVGVRLGADVAPGETIGAVGETGDAAGPHLHLELRLRGAAVDPGPALRVAASADRRSSGS